MGRIIVSICFLCEAKEPYRYIDTCISEGGLSMKKAVIVLKKSLIVIFALVLMLAAAPESVSAAGPDLVDYEDSFPISKFYFFALHRGHGKRRKNPIRNN